MSRHKPETKQELIDYCLRALGQPVLEINVDEQQLEDRYEEALEYYREFHTEAMFKNYMAYEITEEDVENEYVTLPSSIISVTRVFPMGSSARMSKFSSVFRLIKDDVFEMSGGGLIHYDMAKSYLTTLDMLLSREPSTRFNSKMNRLFINAAWGSDINEGDTILFEVYQQIDEIKFPNIFNDMWLKRYLTALIKKQWGINLSKFSNMQLPGGVSMNGMEILNEANQEIEQLKEELQNTYTYPDNFFVG